MYIQLYQLHGLIRSKNLELGRDEDTGGQIVYIIELAKALAKISDIDRIDIVTRLFVDGDYPGYSRPVEQINEKVGIIRVPCGPSKYVKKVDLLKYLDEFYDNISYYIKTDEQAPDIIHSNYYDSGYICNKLAKDLNIPHVFTAHSLGKPKFDELKQGKVNIEELDSMYNFSKRIKAEQEIIDNANALIVFCEQELKEQFSKYNVNPEDERFKIIHPGVNSERFVPFWNKLISKDETQIKVRKKLLDKMNSVLEKPDKPDILMLSRLEAKKNIVNMVECYASDDDLQEAANLIISAGKILDRAKLTSQQLEIIESIEKIIRKNKLEKKVLLFDEVDYEKEVPELYRIVARKGGLFVDCDITDPLPLTIIEAALSGIPVVANHTCALLSIITKGKSELLINVKRHTHLSEAILKLLNDKDLWNQCARNGVDCILHELTWDIVANRVHKIYQEITK